MRTSSVGRVVKRAPRKTLRISKHAASDGEESASLPPLSTGTAESVGDTPTTDGSDQVSKSQKRTRKILGEHFPRTSDGQSVNSVALAQLLADEPPPMLADKWAQEVARMMRGEDIHQEEISTELREAQSRKRVKAVKAGGWGIGTRQKRSLISAIRKVYGVEKSAGSTDVGQQPQRADEPGYHDAPAATPNCEVEWEEWEASRAKCSSIDRDWRFWTLPRGWIRHIDRDESQSHAQRHAVIGMIRDRYYTWDAPEKHFFAITGRELDNSTEWLEPKGATDKKVEEQGLKIKKHALRGDADVNLKYSAVRIMHHDSRPTPRYRFAPDIQDEESRSNAQLQDDLLAVIDAHQTSASKIDVASLDASPLATHDTPQDDGHLTFPPLRFQVGTAALADGSRLAAEARETSFPGLQDSHRVEHTEQATSSTDDEALPKGSIRSRSGTNNRSDERHEEPMLEAYKPFSNPAPSAATARGGRQASSFTPSARLTQLDMSPSAHPVWSQARAIHFTRVARQQPAAEPNFGGHHEAALLANLKSSKQPDIRTRLRQWQDLHGNKEEDTKQESVFQDDPQTGDFPNSATRLPDINPSLRNTEADQQEEREAEAHFMSSQAEDLDSGFDTRALQMGDLVELEFLNQDRESVIAIYIRRSSRTGGQFFTISGRWIFAEDRMVPYSIPGWVSPKAVEPLLEHMPEARDGAAREELYEQAYVHDLSVPREVAAPLVSRMVQFWSESQEIYRNNASSLDNAHNILAHETDLRYGSLVSAATTLLQVPADKLPATALYTVRAALTRAGFAFNIDRRSHRLTGYLQIRSKEQVKMVNTVRRWIRDWQDDLAKRAALAGTRDQHVKTPATAQYVYGFLQKARNIIEQSRKDRHPTPSGTISPSKKRFPITPKQNCVKVTSDLQFTDQEVEIVRFLEAWTCSTLFIGLPGLQSLPPLLLQATGMYEDLDLDMVTGWMFMQELGTIMPYENRVRFDQHLLLPSSQHSKPLQNLMTSLLDMRDKPNFFDTMSGIRRNWGDMPVYCIDEASAQEIDDGLSVERAGADEWWVRIHVANPTAFFERDHPLAKMARHMGESLYMPERTYTMLPRWATVRHFSLAKNRPCLTFSVRMDREGHIKEHMINSGFIRNAISLTKDEAQELIGHAHEGPQKRQHTLTVGGELPPRKPRKNFTANVTPEQVQELRTLHMLAQKRSDIRRANGGVSYDNERPDVEVWQSWDSPGLAWDHPHRKGRRSVEGDPVISMKTRELGNVFAAPPSPAQMMVQEMMLLAGEVSGMWCAERQIPALFRGTSRKPGLPDPDTFLREVLEPATKASPTGERPMHLGMDYIMLIGSAALRTRPLKHRTLGLNYYEKVTSPLRRYGDMIAHWQIEAALREEARRGTSLVTEDTKVDRSFLPFSARVLETVMLGLQPREHMIMRAKSYANQYWGVMLLFRAFHHGECELPFYTEADTSKARMRMWVASSADFDPRGFAHGYSVELNMPVAMRDPKVFGMEEALRGDVWEAEIYMVNVTYRRIEIRPVRLVDRPVATPIPASLRW
ncbi:3'-5' RNA exonuclease complex component [Saxophila tyrrhenica]|uniref:3'-5' RNA exonuclease complex component n=1 Tax=Saxophila tyrrhenica TaxID=1690608 RepID=A0AAV9P0C5_9PEZI|nr:3'-5' RNA exonuclease complex component [Saxophila tyrrhenica]